MVGGRVCGVVGRGGVYGVVGGRVSDVVGRDGVCGMVGRGGVCGWWLGHEDAVVVGAGCVPWLVVA